MGCSASTGKSRIEGGKDTMSKYEQTPNTGSTQLGMHILAIRKFIAEHPAAKTDHMTTSQLNRAFIKSESAGTGQPYISLYSDLRDEETETPLVAPATVFVSHAWRYSFYDVVVDVMEQHEKTNPDSYFWFDLFTNNQNEIASKDFDWFSSTFRNGIKDIGEVLLVLSPWNDLKPVKRCWCLFEIFNSLQESDVKFHISLPTSEVSSLKSAIVEDSKCLIQALTDIQAEMAEAFLASDREMIFDVIKASEGGFPHVNRQVKNGLRSWYVTQLHSLIGKHRDDHYLVLTAAEIMRNFAYHDDALKNALQSLEIKQGDEVFQGKAFGVIASIYAETEQVEKALEYHTKALTIKLKTLTENHPEVAAVYNNMALIYDDQGQHDKALELYQKSLTIRIETLGESHSDVGGSYNNIGNLYMTKGDPDKALEYHTKSLVINQATSGENHPSTASSYNNIALIYQEKGELEKALEFYRKTITVKLSTVGEDHPDVASCYHNIANVYSDRKQLDIALDHYKQSLSMRLNTFGENHADVASSYNNMASTYRDMGDLEKALEYYTKALTIRLKILGEGHMSVASSYNNLAMVYGDKGLVDQALQLYDKALTIKLSSLGEGHLALTSTYNNMAIAYRHKGNMDRAFEFFHKSLAIQRKVYGNSHPAVAMFYNNLGQMYSSTGELDKSLEYYDKSLAIKLKVYGENHPSVADMYQNIGLAYEELKDYKKGLENMNRALTIRQGCLEEQHPEIIQAIAIITRITEAAK